MSPQPPVDQDAAKRAIDIAEFLAKFAGSAGIVWAFVAKVWKPYVEWRRKNLALLMREILKDELSQLSNLAEQAQARGEREDACIERLEDHTKQVRELFHEHDLMLDVMLDNRDRIDETNELLDGVGFSNERRDLTEKKKEIANMVDALADRRRARRRHLPIEQRAD